MTEPGVLPGADHVLVAGVDPVACVDVGALAAPAPRVLRQVRRPQGVTPPVFRLEQGELRSGMRTLAAGQKPPPLSPGPPPVPRPAPSHPPPQLAVARLFYSPTPATP